MRLIRYLSGCILIFAIVFTAICGKEKISQDKVTSETPEYKGILTVWHLDGFEGGSGSRREFLMSVSRTFEKQNQGVLVMVINHTNTSAIEGISKGDYPDMISYSNGLKLDSLTEISATSNRFNGGKIGDKTYALAWCRGGYVIIVNPNHKEAEKDLTSPMTLNNAIISQTEYSQPLTALMLDGFMVENYKIMSPMDAYVNFTAGKSPYLIGTQRDIVRLNNRGFSYECKPIENFNDLYQYISITASQSDKVVMAERFINLLMSENVQQSLNKISMFSVDCNSNNDDTNLKKMQEIKSVKTISPFILPENLKENQQNAVDFMNGDKFAQDKIKKLIT